MVLANEIREQIYQGLWEFFNDLGHWRSTAFPSIPAEMCYGGVKTGALAATLQPRIKSQETGG